MWKVRPVVIYCWVVFLVTISASIAWFAWPEGVAIYFNIPSPASGVICFFIRMMALGSFVLGLAYLFSLIYPDASHPLLMLATCGQVLGTLYWFAAWHSTVVAPRDRIAGGWILSGIAALGGIYAVVATRKQKAGPIPEKARS